LSRKNVSDRAVNRVLETVPGFSGAVVRSQLSDGPTNASYLVEQGGERYVLRLDKPEASRLGLDRGNEKRVCEMVAGSGLAPVPVYFDAEAGIYLRCFLPGRSWNRTDLVAPGNLQRLARVLKILHSLPTDGADYEPVAATRRYARQLDTPSAASIAERAEIIARKIGARPETRALCHNDLVCQNVLEGERLFLIDWEYAGIGDPFFDLAVVVQHHGLDTESARGFLDAYLGRSASAQEIEHFNLQCKFYACLLQLWRLRI